MKAIMSDRMRKWLSKAKTRKQVRKAVDALHNAVREGEDSVVVEIDSKKYSIRFLNKLD